MKTCQDSETIVGCGKEKPESEFQRTAHGTMKICRECLQNYRHGRMNYRVKHERSKDADLYAQFDRLTRRESCGKSA